MTSTDNLVYLVKDGDRYYGATQAFDFRKNGSPKDWFYAVYFNGGPLDPTSRHPGKCQPTEDGQWQVWGPKGEDLGVHDTLEAVCKALEPYTYRLHYGNR